MMDSVQLWLATPDAAQHFDPAQLTDDERDRMARLRRGKRGPGFVVRPAPRPAALARAHPAMRIAVDLELHRARRRLAAASTVFSKSEMRALEAAPGPEREQ